MRNAICNLFGAVGIVSAISPSALAQAPQPKVLHGQVSSASGAHGLDAAIADTKSGSQPVWLAYDIPVLHHESGNWYGDRTVYLEDEQSTHQARTVQDTSQGKRVESDHATMLLRVNQGDVTKVRLEDPDRDIDASGTRFVWLSAIGADESVRELASLALSDQSSKPLQDAAVFATSQHGTPSATAALVSMIAPGQQRTLRKSAAFWLASARGHDGLLAIETRTRNDADGEFRKELTFDLTLPTDPEGLHELVRMAHDDASPEVRKQAQFWMATKGGNKVAADLHASAEKDPDSEVRKAAVFAITHPPQEESTTQLIALADTSHDGEVRKQAVFWLGQSSDPRALQFLTRLLGQ